MLPGSSRSLVLYWNALVFVLVCLVGLQNAAAAPTGPIVHTSPETGHVTVVDPTTHEPIPQFPATDGGSGTLNKILWATFSIVVGAPLGGGGVRGGCVATGAAVGLVGVVSLWATLVNALPMPLGATADMGDLILTIVLTTSFCFFTFLGAYLRCMHAVGLVLLGATGGTSLMMRVVILKRDLLIPPRVYPANLVLVALGALAGGLLIVRHRRVMAILATSLISTFLVGLGVDLVLNMDAPEQGMGRGLRVLMDRNAAHLADIVGTHYAPTVKTQVVLGASLGLVPLLAYGQHRLFPGPFGYALRAGAEHEREASVYTLSGVDWAGRPVYTGSAREAPVRGPVFGAQSRFSL